MRPLLPGCLARVHVWSHGLLLGATVVVVPSLAPAQRPPTSLISGIVADTTQHPTPGSVLLVPGVEVALLGAGLVTYTDSAGTFRLAAVPPGTYMLRMRRVGYEPSIRTLRVAGGDSLDILHYARPVARTLDAITVEAKGRRSARLEEFESRRRSGRGVFLTRSDIEERHPVVTTDLMRGMTSVAVQDSIIDGSQRIPVVVSRRGGKLTLRNGVSACVLRTVVDDVVMPAGFPLDQISARDIEGIEVYSGPSSIPAKFSNLGSWCGLVVIWTRDGS